ncbi:MAG TPA: ABC transporter permease [Methylomirabilota bacterium]|nr:ABC transporter permease [Methylomirabilota bacterium]
MMRYLAKRLTAAGIILVGISVITFCLIFLVPADPISMIAGRNATAETRAQIRHQLGLDRPLPVQYGDYVVRLAQGDLGRSYAQKTQVSELIHARLPATLLLMAAGIVAELVIGLPAGIYAATRRGEAVDRGVMMLSFIGISAPQFIVGLLLLYLFAYMVGWFPLSGYGGISHLVLPAITLGIAGGGTYSRLMRSQMLDVLRQDYIRTARAKGLPERTVLLTHALRNAVLPVIAQVGYDMGFLITNAVIVESVFGWPGIGQLMWQQGIQRLDYPIIMGVTITAALFIVLGSLIADLIVPLIDPRIRLR